MSEAPNGTTTATGARETDGSPRARFTSFEESTHADWQLIASQLPLTQAMAGANIVDQLRLLARDHGGFP